MRQISTKTRTLSTQRGSYPIEYILKSREDGGRTYYGASVTNLSTGEKSEVRDLTGDEKRAADFYERIVQGLVTPMTFMDVAEDFVQE